MGKSPDAFRTISEVADWLDTQAHVLRFWESKFPQVKPVKRAGGRRYYRPADMMLLGGIKKLLHDDGMTIKGAQKLLREKGTKYVSGLSQPLDDEDDSIEDIELVEVTTPPLEEERGTVLSFERRDDVAESPPETPDEIQFQEPDAETQPQEPDAEDADLFSLAPAQDAPTDEGDEPPQEDEDDLSQEVEDETPEPEEIPSFVQRLSPKPTQDMSSPPAVEEEEISAPQAPPSDQDSSEEASEIVHETTDETSVDDDSTQETYVTIAAEEPDHSPLSEIATMSRIAPENRADVIALLDRLTALCERIEASENA